MSLLDGKRAIVTGGGRNIGAEYWRARQFTTGQTLVVDGDLFMP